MDEKVLKPEGAYGLRVKGKLYLVISNLPFVSNCIPELVIFEMEQFRVLKRMCV